MLLALLVTEATGLSVQTENATVEIAQCAEVLAQIRSQVSDADIPDLFKERENDFTNFSTMLRKAETEL